MSNPNIETGPPTNQGSMNLVTAVALIVIGGFLILGPLLANAYNGNRDKDRVAEFYTRNGTGAVLPYAMAPSGYTNYDWGCFVAGAIMVWIGVTRNKSGNSPGLQFKWEKRQ